MRLKILDLFKRDTDFDKKKGIIQNGSDNLYAEKVERVINSSVTAKTAATIMASYITGNGFGDAFDDIVVNPKKSTSLRKLLSIVSKNISKHKGVYIHFNYNANYKIDRFDVLPYTHCRKGKKDDKDYNGKILVYDDWSKRSIRKEDLEQFDVFNPKEEVIKSQVEKAGGWNKYKGQILYFSLDEEYEYSLAFIDPVLNDCDSEGQASLYKNRSLRKGFFGKTLMITKPLVGGMNDYSSPDEYNKAVNERDSFKETAESFLGAENSGSLLHVELEHNEESLDNAIRVQQIPSDINDKMFEYTENSVFKNILMAFNNLPTGLVRSDNALFSNSGEALTVMKETYQENTEYERNAVERLFNWLMKYYKEEITDLQIQPLIQADDTRTLNQ